MKILVVAATQAEIAPLITALRLPLAGQPHTATEVLGNHPDIEVLITGVGMVATAFALGAQLATGSYNLAINLGIAGSFDRRIALGDVVEVIHDSFPELGAEDDEAFIPLDVMGFGQTSHAATAQLNTLTGTSTLQQVTGVTVNTVHGNERSIARLQQRSQAQLESMEGAAFFYACAQAGVPALQIRAVSNYVEKRNRDAWNIGLAVKNLNTFATDLLQKIG